MPVTIIKNGYIQPKPDSWLSDEARRVLNAIGKPGAHLQIKMEDLAEKAGVTLKQLRAAIAELDEGFRILMDHPPYEPRVYWHLDHSEPVGSTKPQPEPEPETSNANDGEPQYDEFL